MFDLLPAATGIKPDDQLMVRPGGMNTAARRMRGMHGPEKQIIDAAKMGVIVVCRNARLEKTVERQGVDKRLKMILVAVHAFGQGLGIIMLQVGPQIIGFIIRDKIAPLKTKDQINKTFHQTLDRAA